MSLNRTSAVILGIVMLMITGNGMADEVWIKNGDHLSGEIIRMEKKTLTFKTSYAGEILVNWEEISAIITDSPIQVVLSDGTSVRGIVTTDETGKLQVKTELLQEPLTFDLAQVDFINPKPPGPSLKLSGRVNVGVDISKGNTDTESYHVDGELVARTEKNRYIVGAEFNLEKESDRKTADNALLYMSYDHFLTEKWFFYTNADFEKDEFKDLNLRTTVGAGSGYQFFETKLKNLSVRGGLAYVNEDYDIEDQDQDYSAGRWAVRYDQYFFEKFVQFFHHHEGIVSLEDTEDIFIRTRTGLRFPLGKSFNITAQYNWDWDNSPAPDKDRVDERYLFTLGYSWE